MALGGMEFGTFEIGFGDFGLQACSGIVFRGLLLPLMTTTRVERLMVLKHVGVWVGGPSGFNTRTAVAWGSGFGIGQEVSCNGATHSLVDTLHNPILLSPKP